jgi:hypothetical protein
LKGSDKNEETKQKQKHTEEKDTSQAWAKGVAKQPDPVI